jgi:hypothetical protein
MRDAGLHGGFKVSGTAIFSNSPILASKMYTGTAMIKSLYRQRALTAIKRSNGFRSVQEVQRRRHFASVAIDDNSLPLKGFRVLDMTRVLAGVRLLLDKMIYGN